MLRRAVETTSSNSATDLRAEAKGDSIARSLKLSACAKAYNAGGAGGTPA
jgi:hypothetical protein